MYTIRLTGPMTSRLHRRRPKIHPGPPTRSRQRPLPRDSHSAGMALRSASGTSFKSFRDEHSKALFNTGQPRNLLN